MSPLLQRITKICWNVYHSGPDPVKINKVLQSYDENDTIMSPPSLFSAVVLCLKINIQKGKGRLTESFRVSK